MSDYICNLVIPGFPKCGTSSLHEYLNIHPELNMSHPKECHFFSVDETWKRGTKFHNKLFKGRGIQQKRFGESSTTYCICEAALRRISHNLDNPKVIMLLRDPVERAVSHYKWLYALGLENRGFLEAIQVSGYEFDPNRPVEGCFMGYLEFSSYSKWVPKWVSAFGIDNVLLLQSEKLRLEPINILNDCAAFLNVSKIDWELPREKNRTEDVTIRSDNRIVRALNLILPESFRSAIKFNFPYIFNTIKASLVKETRRPSPLVADDEILMLRDLLKDESEFFHSLFKN